MQLLSDAHAAKLRRACNFSHPLMDKLSNPKLIFTLKSKEISILGLINSRFNPENSTKKAVTPLFLGLILFQNGPLL